MSLPTRESKLRALFLGVLVGDALGAPLNGLKAGHIGQLVPGGWYDEYLQPETAVLQPEKPNRNHLPGLHSALGTAFLAFCGCRTDAVTTQHASARAAKALVDLAANTVPHAEDFPHLTGHLRKPGKPLREALERWGADFPWEPAEHLAQEQSSEGAFPCVPALAVLLNADLTDTLTPIPDFDVAPAVAVARFTHLRESSLVAAAVIVEAARLLLDCPDGKRLDAKATARALHAYARATEDRLRKGELPNRWSELGWGFPVQRFSECLSPLVSLLDVEDLGLVEKTLVKQAAEFQPDRPVTHLQHGFAPILIPWVLLKVLGPDSHSAAVEDVLNRGGETSLAAALVSGLLGARYGMEHLREEWLAGLRIRREAEALLDSPGEAAEEAWSAAEVQLTTREEAFRKPLYERAKRDAPEALKPKKEKKPEPKLEPNRPTDKLPFAPPPQLWLGTEAEAELAPWEKQRLKAERGRKRIDWKEQRREHQRHLAEKQAELGLNPEPFISEEED
ncbi:MAG: ADP-ribosylglycohydrolase family protein [Candidatus Sumerlaeia bacterium]|nr:ADP-ribosylglycohydrolase family protein [Candidatus Sumerlaeia bacterium]